MSENFNKFHKRALVSAKAGADFLNWIAIGFFASCLYEYIPAPDCPLPIGDDLVGLQDMLCKWGHSAHMSALAWLGFSVLRIFFIASRWQSGPFLMIDGLKIERQDGKPVTLKFAARYALIEWLPFHILSVYMLMCEMPADIYTMGSAITLAVAAQMIWLAPIIFRYRGKNISEILTQGQIVFNDKKKAKIEKASQNKWKMTYEYGLSCIVHIFYIPLAVLFILLSIQILRTPDINPEYERLLYADREPVWEKNIYFSLEGLTAPANVKDTYAYGLTKSLQQFKKYEALKRRAHISYTYQALPESGNAPEVRTDQELEIKSEGWKDLSCLYSVLPEPEAKCANKDDLKSYIQANQIIWDRFNNLPEYDLLRAPLQTVSWDDYEGFSYQNLLISLAQLKAAQIIDMAESGEPEAAFQEWLTYMKLYRSIANEKETMIFKAIGMIAFGQHLDAFEKLLYLRPQLVKTYATELDTILKPSDGILFRADYMLSDDIGAMEPLLLELVGNANAIRNDMYNCIIEFQKLAHMPPHQFPFGQMPKLCPLEDVWSNNLFTYAITEPGYFATNIAHTLMSSGHLKGKELIGNIIINDIKLRMSLLATEILQQDIDAEDIPSFLASTPPERQNPITQKPFEWDSQTRSLFFVTPHTGRKNEFRLNL